MSALEIMGVPVSVQMGDTRSPLDGGLVVTGRGNTHPVRLNPAHIRSFTTARPVPYDEGEALIQLILGMGHVWTFEDRCLSSRTGVQPYVGYDFKVMEFSNHHYLRIAAGTTTRFKAIPYKRPDLSSYFASAKGWGSTPWGGGATPAAPLGANGPWTVVLTRHVGGVLERYAARDDDVWFKDGVSVPALPWLTTTTAAQPTIFNSFVDVHGLNDAGAAATFDLYHLVVLPWRAPAAWMQLWTQRTSDFPPMPYVELKEGSGAPKLHMCEVTDIAHVSAHLDSDYGYVNNGMIISFGAQEVVP